MSIGWLGRNTMDFSGHSRLNQLRLRHRLPGPESQEIPRPRPWRNQAHAIVTYEGAFGQRVILTGVRGRVPTPLGLRQGISGLQGNARNPWLGLCSWARFSCHFFSPLKGLLDGNDSTAKPDAPQTTVVVTTSRRRSAFWRTGLPEEIVTSEKRQDTIPEDFGAVVMYL